MIFKVTQATLSGAATIFAILAHYNYGHPHNPHSVVAVLAGLAVFSGLLSIIVKA